MYIGGLDVGTTGCKLTVFDENGRQLAKAYRDYPVLRGANIHEIDADAILNAAYEVIKEIAGSYPDIAGIGVTTFGETFVLTDEKGTPLCPAMLYTDPRGAEQCERLSQKIGVKKAAEITGIKPHEMYSLPKLMWIKENKPDIFAKASYVLQIEDFLVFHLTGQRKIDYSLATRTMGFDIRKLTWDKEIFAAAGIDEKMFSTPVPSGTITGNITKETAAKTGLSENTKIICVSQDQIAAAVGAGVFSSELAVDGAGTVECITPVFDEIPDMDVMTNGNFAVVPYVIPGKYVCYAFLYTGGALMQWCTDTLAKKEKDEAKMQGISVNELLEKKYADTHKTDEPGKLLVLPHFAGAATPYMDTGSKGTIIGLTTATSVAEIYRGCMEGVCYEMVLNMEWLKPSGVKFKRLNATGGGAHSKEWMQMKADMLNMPITALETVDAGTVGSAMLTGIAVGVFKDLDEAAGIMVHPIATYEPRKEWHEKYMEVYKRYKEIYKAVRPLLPGGDKIVGADKITKAEKNTQDKAALPAKKTSSKSKSVFTPKEDVYCFVDGSYNQVTKVYGCGGFLMANGQKYIIQESGNDEQAAKHRNISGEVLGAQRAVEKAIELGLKEITIYHDYNGIAGWANGWKTNIELTRNYKAFMDKARQSIKINFVQVAGHVGIEGNEEADRLAKEAVGLL